MNQKKLKKDDPYEWFKDRLHKLRKKTTNIKHDGLMTSPGKIWSVRKFFILDYCIDGFVPIFSNNFDNWYYVDTHCGAGLIDLGEKLYKEKLPGTPLIAAFRFQKRRFSKYYFSDKNSNATSTLKKRLNALKLDIPDCSYEIESRDFAKTVEFLKKPFEGKSGFFIVIDPKGFKDIKWDLMKSLLKIKKADIFFIL